MKSKILAVVLFLLFCCLQITTAEQIRDYYFPDITTLDGYPVYQIGDVAIWRVSPTFVPDLAIQRGNASPFKKIVPKRSYEIQSNYIGGMPEFMPDSHSGKEATNYSCNLIDGDPRTGARFPGTSAPSNEAAWCRIDLPYEMKINAVN